MEKNCTTEVSFIHSKTIYKIMYDEVNGWNVLNLLTGKGFSHKELLHFYGQINKDFGLTLCIDVKLCNDETIDRLSKIIINRISRHIVN